MDEHNISHTGRHNSRRKKKSQFQIFKETLLPIIIIGIAVILIFVFIIGSIVRAVQENRYKEKLSQEASVLTAERTQEAEMIVEQATLMSAQYNYEDAVALIENFSGDYEDFPALKKLYDQCKEAEKNMVKWTDTNDILNLSFQMLIADPQRAFQDEKFGSAYNKNFVTTEEFTKILLSLYENNFVLIRLSDVFKNGQIQEFSLPVGKKPLILTQTQVNYNTYMVDGDGDKLPDKDGDGFASKLVIDANDNITCEIVDADGQTQTGAFDLAPILNSFIATHPDFSYKGARAVLALTGYDGLFGYRTNSGAESTFGEVAYNEEVATATKIAKKLRLDGYELACYTYDNSAYGQLESAQIQYDLTKWRNEVTPILGDVDTLVFAKNSDISDSTAPYDGEKINVLRDFGFTKYLGFSNTGMPWCSEGEGYVRFGRVLVTGANMKNHPDWFEDIFNAGAILDTARP